MFPLIRLLFLLLLIYQFVVQAADPSSPHDESPTNCVDGCSKRTLFDIVWSCVSTTIICAWTSIHPNIPPRESYLKRTLRRLELMFWTIVAPEILPCWALNQRLAAMTVRDVHNTGKCYKEEPCGFLKRWFSWHELPNENQAWTLKHGHFLIMGGFQLVEPVEGDSASPEASTGTEQVAPDDVVNIQPTAANTPSAEGPNADAEKGPAPLEEGRVTVLTLEMLRILVKDPEIRIRITEDEITDRSKGDALSKIIFILQSSWFIMQCVARRVQGLSLTQLELTTLALASLNGITFLIWWDKPLGACMPVRVYLKRKLTDAERNTAGRGQSRRSKLVPDLQKLLADHIPVSFRDMIQLLLNHWRSIYGIFYIYLALPIIVVGIILPLPLYVFMFAFMYTIQDLVGESTSFPAGATHVPTFYVPNHRYSKWFHTFLLMSLVSIFGGIHCVGWNFPFLTDQEKGLWHTASLTVTILPIPFILISLVYILLILLSGDDNDESLNELLIFFATLVYLPARLVLLGLALALLRHLPPSTLIAIDWTKFFPHLPTLSIN